MEKYMETIKQVTAAIAVNNKQVFAPSDNNVLFATTVVKYLTKLKEKRVTWEATVYAKSNDSLYDLLAKCLELFNDRFLTAGDEDRKALRNELGALLKTDGIKVQRNTTTLTMFIRFVFGNDRKRAHNYAYVLKAAISYEITAPKLKGFILENGGIEEIKRKMVVSEEAKANKQKREDEFGLVKAKAELAEISPLATVKYDLVNNSTGFAVLIVKPSTKGNSNVVAVLENAKEDLVDALFKRIAKDSLAKKQEAKTIETETATLKSGTASNDIAKTKELLAA
jgi:hypothetical protein